MATMRVVQFLGHLPIARSGKTTAGGRNATRQLRATIIFSGVGSRASSSSSYHPTPQRDMTTRKKKKKNLVQRADYTLSKHLSLIVCSVLTAFNCWGLKGVLMFPTRQIIAVEDSATTLPEVTPTRRLEMNSKFFRTRKCTSRIEEAILMQFRVRRGSETLHPMGCRVQVPAQLRWHGRGSAAMQDTSRDMLSSGGIRPCRRVIAIGRSHGWTQTHGWEQHHRCGASLLSTKKGAQAPDSISCSSKGAKKKKGNAVRR